jgi:localization factor PodJL
LYERGRGIPADAKQAHNWYAQAARGGNRKAMHNLAVSFAEGAGTEKNYAKAAQWFTAAANLGLIDSQFNLAVLYERGLGVLPSLRDAYKWYAIAAAQGDAESKNRLDALATQLTPEDKLAADKEAADFHPQPLNRDANETPSIAQVIP